MGASHDPAELAPLLEQLDISGPVQPFLVLADWLLQRGDSWGEIITEQCMAIEGDGQYSRSKVVMGLPPGWVGMFRRGFVLRAIFDANNAVGDTFAVDLEKFLAHPMTHLLVDLELRHLQPRHVVALAPHRVRLERARIELFDPQGDRYEILQSIGDFQNVVVGGVGYGDPYFPQTVT